MKHWSSCAVHNAPAYPLGPCDCGAVQGRDPLRRADVTRNTTEELAIREAVRAIEAMPADTRLTDAVVLLDRARERVADYIDGVSE